MQQQQSKRTQQRTNGKPSGQSCRNTACNTAESSACKRDRRTFCTAIGWGGVASLFGGTLYASAQFLSPAVLYEPPSFFRAGAPEHYPQGTVSELWKDEERVWVVHTDAGLYSLVATCTHLGCAPNWLPGEQVFKCPCHGSTFTLAGDVVSGPAPAPLYRTPIRLAPDGQLIIGTGRLGIRLASQANREPRRSSAEYVVST
jgi:cytochrome b6-f complex iron-sulfur subunit